MSFTAVYDANVLHPASVRDLLIRVGQTGLFAARWTEAILDEVIDSILRRHPELDRPRLVRTRELMCEAIPDCLVTGYERLIEGLDLPDPDDRHVLAAAIRAHAQVIVTANLSDFPPEQLSPYFIEAQSPDEFVLYLVDLAPGTVAAIAQQQADALQKPPQTLDDLLERLAGNGLPRAVAALREHLAP